MEKTYRENIYGVEVIFTSTESEEYTRKIVGLVRDTISSVITDGENVTVPKAAIVACMSLCEEVLRMRSEQDVCAAEKQWTDSETERLKTELKAVKAENGDLKSEVLRLKIEISNGK